MIICFAEIELIYTQDAYDIAQEICKLLYPEYQVMFGVHCDKPKNMHIHFAINPVSMQTGRKLYLSYAYQAQLEKALARILEDYKDQPKDILDRAQKGAYGQRYTCVNLQNTNTIEFRIFRGTLKYNTFIATLQLVNWICEVAIALFDEEMRQLTWNDFVADCSELELVQYLKERCLYVNDEVAGGEEV